MSDAVDDPRCPECGGPIGQTATYCMHCSTDLTEERNAADVDGDGTWDRAEGVSQETRSSGGRSDERVGSVDEAAAGVGPWIRDRLGVGTGGAGNADGRLLAPDGLVDDTLTAVVGIVGGVVVGAVGTLVLAVVTGSGWAVAFGLVAWLGSTAYLVRRRTVQAAVSRTGYAVAIVLLTVPVVAASPVVDVEGGLAGRGGLFFVLLLFVSVPAAVAAAVGWLAAQFVPAGAEGGEG